MWISVESTTVLLTIIYSVKIYKCTKLYVYIQLQYDEQYSKTGSDTSIHQQKGNWIHCNTFKLQHMQIFEWMIQIYIYSQGWLLGIYCWVNQASYAHTLWSHFDFKYIICKFVQNCIHIRAHVSGPGGSEWDAYSTKLYLCKLYILDASLAYPSPGPDMFTCIEKSLWE